jgi:hypothetical protein
MIKTKPFRLTPNTYFKIVLMRQIQRVWWLHLLVIFAAVSLLFQRNDHPSSALLIVFGFAYLPALVIYLYFWATSSSNSLLFEEREMTAYEDKLTMSAGGNSSELVYASVRYVVETSDFFLLYIARSMFVYVPKDAFVNSDDLEVFSKYFRSKGNT